MICAEWWSWEVLLISSGLLPGAEVAVGVMGLTFQISSLGYMLASALGGAASTRVSNALGAGNARGAALAFRVAAAVTACVAAAAAAALFALRAPLVALFTEEPRTTALALGVMPVVCASLLGDSAVAVLGAMLRAAGRQGVGAALNLVG